MGLLGTKLLQLFPAQLQHTFAAESLLPQQRGKALHKVFLFQSLQKSLPVLKELRRRALMQPAQQKRIHLPYPLSVHGYAPCIRKFLLYSCYHSPPALQTVSTLPPGQKNRHPGSSACKASGLTAWRLHVFGENAAGQHIAACPAEKTVNNNLLLQVQILKGTIFLLRRRYALREPPFCLFISQMWFFDCFFGGLRHGAQKRLTKNLQDH